MASPLYSRYDVIVVGARCAGAATALLLARDGLRVLVVDRAARGTDTLSTHALLRPAVVQLRRWGLLDAVVAAGTPGIRRTVFHYGPERVAVTLRPVAGADALYAPRRTVLDSVLLGAAERAGAEVLTSTAVRDLLRDRTGRVTGVTLDNGRGGLDPVRARLTVGADGVRSLVATQVGARIERQGRYASALRYGYFEGLPTDGYEWFYGERATAGLVPTNDGQTLVFAARAATPEGHPVPPGLDGVRAVLSEAWPAQSGRLDAARLVSPLRQFRGIRGFQRTAYGPGWALVGDAGYFVDPMSAHGISQALRDAELLADAVGSAFRGVPEPVALAHYQGTRDRISRPLFEAVDRIASLSWNLDEVRQHLSALNAAVSDEVDLVCALDAPTAMTVELSA
jgi:flavin-dependent dehydrogenase